MSINLPEVMDFHQALMTATGGGIWDDLGWLCMADIQQMAGDTSKALNKLGLCSVSQFLSQLEVKPRT